MYDYVLKRCFLKVSKVECVAVKRSPYLYNYLLPLDHAYTGFTTRSVPVLRMRSYTAATRINKQANKQYNNNNNNNNKTQDSRLKWFI